MKFRFFIQFCLCFHRKNGSNTLKNSYLGSTILNENFRVSAFSLNQPEEKSPMKKKFVKSFFGDNFECCWRANKQNLQNNEDDQNVNQEPFIRHHLSFSTSTWLQDFFDKAKSTSGRNCLGKKELIRFLWKLHHIFDRYRS